MGNFLECLKLLADHYKTDEGVVLENASKNLKLASPKIQIGNLGPYSWSLKL